VIIKSENSKEDYSLRRPYENWERYPFPKDAQIAMQKHKI
jgi:hypothetical protein